MSDKLVLVRVLNGRSLSLNGERDSQHHVAGDVVELPEDDAKQLAEDGYVERVK